MSFYDDCNLFYFGSEDGLGGTKALAVERTKDGLVFNARRWGWEADGKDFSYDFVTAALSGTEAKPCSWHDAADLYKTWAVRQRWCKALLFANATDRPLTAKYELPDGSQRTVTVAPDEIVKVGR